MLSSASTQQYSIDAAKAVLQLAYHNKQPTELTLI